MAIDIFSTIFSYSNGELFINRKDILFEPEFAELFKRSKSIPGDSDGRKKLHAFKELKYIYFIADQNSVPNRNGYSRDECESYAHDYSDVESGWNPDELVKSCIKRYEALTTDPDAEIVIELLRILKSNHRPLSILRDSITSIFDKGKLNKDDLNEYFGYQSLLSKYAAEIPTNIEKLTNALQKIKESKGKRDESLMMRGNMEYVPISALPENEQ